MDGSDGRAVALVRLARTLGEDDAVAAIDALRDVADAPALAETLRRHHLIPLLWSTVGDSDLRAMLGETYAPCAEWIARPRPSADESLATIAALQATLAAADVPCMVMKGVHFAHRLYGGMGRRPQHDVDLLVRRRDFRGAARALRASGLTERRRDLHSATWTRDGIQVDLHWCFRNSPVYRPDEERIWRERLTYTIGATTFATPSDGDVLLALALALFQDIGLGSAKLKQLLDAHLLIGAVDRTFDWDAFFALRRADGTRAIVTTVLDLVQGAFDARRAQPRLAAALRAHGARGAVAPADACGLVLGARGGAANRAWFFRVYPGSIARYWLWLLPRKLPAYLSGSAPDRAPTSMRPSLATLRAMVEARRGRAARDPR